MKATFYLTWQAIKLYMRTRTFIFTMVVTPLLLFFVYMSIFAGGKPERVALFLGPALVLMATTNGVYGVGGDLLLMRESGSLLPYQFTPARPLQILGSRLCLDFLLTLTLGILEIILAIKLYHMPFHAHLWDLLIISCLAAVVLGTLGAIIIGIANSFPQANMLSQLLFLALLFLSGMSMPLDSLPGFARHIAAFLPTTALVTSLNGVLTRGDHLILHWREVVVLVASMITFSGVAVSLFRWDREQKSSMRDRLFAAVALAPMILAGIWFNL
jgi:ABC-type multidrug transport system permease subunit